MVDYSVVAGFGFFIILISLIVYFTFGKKDDDDDEEEDAGDEGGDDPSSGSNDTPVLRDTPDTMRNASSVWGGEAIGVGLGRGRLDSPQGWASGKNKVGEWYQFDNGVVGKIKGVAVKGRADYDQYVKTFKVKYRGKDGIWKDVDNGKVFRGNVDQNTQIDVNFKTPVDARFIRIYPQTFYGHMSMRSEIMAGKTKTDKKITIIDVPYNGHNSSGNHKGDPIGRRHGSGRLDSEQAWSADENVIGKWYELNLDDPKEITGVVIKGRGDVNQWVKTFTVKYKDDNGKWSDVDKGYTFDGSHVGNNQVNVFFNTPVKTSAIRIYPRTWANHISLRAGLMTGGSSGSEGYMIQPDEYEIVGFSF